MKKHSNKRMDTRVLRFSITHLRHQNNWEQSKNNCENGKHKNERPEFFQDHKKHLNKVTILFFVPNILKYFKSWSNYNWNFNYVIKQLQPSKSLYFDKKYSKRNMDRKKDWQCKIKVIIYFTKVYIKSMQNNIRNFLNKEKDLGKGA